MKIAGQHTIMVCRIPESVGYLPMLSVRAEGLEPALFYWAGDKRPREDVGGFESVELDRRYIVEVAKGQDHAWLRQLFPPSFIDWLASNTPVDFGFRLDGGIFTCECPQYRGQHRADGEVDFEHLDLLGGTGGRAASRIRDEVLEEADVSWGGTNPDSAAAHEARAKGRKHGRLLGLVMKLAGDISDDSVKQFAEKHGMSAKDSAEFHANHIRLPLPGTASDVLTGPLPGTDRQGDLAWLEFSSAVDMQRNYIAVVVETPTELPSAWVDADDVTVPGFGEGLARGRPRARARARPRPVHPRPQGLRLPGGAGGHGRLAERRRDRGLRAECGGDCRRAGRERTQRSLNRYLVCACGCSAKASTLAGSIRNTGPTSSPVPKPPSPTSKCQTLPYFASMASASRCRASWSVTRTAIPSTTTSRPRAQVLVPVVSATCLLCSRLRAFCSRLPVQKYTVGALRQADQRSHMRPAVSAHRGEPVQLGALEGARDL